MALLDYVSAWYVKAASYIHGTRIRVAFVSTNSITQGEQVGVLWRALFDQGIKIHFAHRTFAWESEARGKAHVHVVIVGFGAFDFAPKRLYEYEAVSSRPAGQPNDEERTEAVVTVVEAPNISPYLFAGPDMVLTARSKPLCPVPEIVFGSMPNDGGHLLMSRFGRDMLLREQPEAAKYLRRFVGAEEFLNGIERWCLWLDGENPAEFRRMPAVMDRVHAVAIHRKKSKRQTTKELAEAPACFGEIRQPDRAYLLIPSVSSERRRYIPIGFMRPEIIASNLVLLVPGANLYHFGVLSSAMHMAWVRQVAGRLESRLSLFQPDRLQQLPLARRADGSATRPRRGSGQANPGPAGGTGGRTSRVPSRRQERPSNRVPGRSLRPGRHAACALQGPCRAGPRGRPLLPSAAVHLRASADRVPLLPLREDHRAAHSADAEEKTLTRSA